MRAETTKNAYPEREGDLERGRSVKELPLPGALSKLERPITAAFFLFGDLL